MTWRYRGGPGTGALGDLGSHLADLAEYLAGPIVRVHTGALRTFVEAARPDRPGPAATPRPALSDETAAVENEDLASFTAAFRDGAVGTFSVSRVAFGHPNSLGFSVFGERAAASFDQARPAEFAFTDATAPEVTRGFRQVLAGPLHPYLEHGLPMTRSASASATPSCSRSRPARSSTRSRASRTGSRPAPRSPTACAPCASSTPSSGPPRPAAPPIDIA